MSRWYSDDRVRKLLGDPPMSHAARRARYDSAVRDDGEAVVRFVICRLDDDTPVGRADLFDIDRTNGHCTFGIAIGDPELWGRGLGTDAVNAIVDFAFGELRVERLMLDTDAENHRAQAAYRKAGFVVEGRRRHRWFVDGAYGDDLWMALLRDEWLALPRLKSWDLMARAIETEGVVSEG